MKIDLISKYLQRQWITCTKEGVEFSNNKIDDFLTLAHFILYAKLRFLGVKNM
jgi:hypothetical protein